MWWPAGNNTAVGPSGGQRPRINEWHHAVMTYAGTGAGVAVNDQAVRPQMTRLYLDGQLLREFYTNLNVIRTTAAPGNQLHIGAYAITAGNQEVATSGLQIGQIRLHDG